MKKLFALLLALLLLQVPVFAAGEPTDADLKTAPIISNLEVHKDEGNIWLEVTVKTPSNVLNAINYYENHELGYNQAGYIGGIEILYTIDGKEGEPWGLTPSPNYEHSDDWNGVFETTYLSEFHVDSEIRVKARYTGADAEGNERLSEWSNTLILNEKVNFKASDWAMNELAEADKLGLIPDCLKDVDLTKPISRAEFAAVCVKVYEALSEKKAVPAADNPFSDTSDIEVLKAYNTGITMGTSDSTFDPDVLLNREQAATMLTRVHKKIAIKDWDIRKDADFADVFNNMFTMPSLFADDMKISPWAKSSVYFMAANGIINGIGNDLFAPKATTDAEIAIGYAQATREQALAIAKRMVENLK